MLGSVEREIAERLRLDVAGSSAMHGGSIGEVHRVDLADGRRLAVKVDRNRRPTLDIEAYMLEYLAAHSTLPVPEVIYSAPELLAMTFLEGGSYFSRNAELHAAELLADLHGIRADRFGLERDTLIGSLPQPNRMHERWVEFFRDERLLAFGDRAREEGRVDKSVFAKIETLAGKLDDILIDPPHPSLLHGDVWTTNVLADDNHITGFIDPAIYYGHPEMELAFITLFSTFGATFFNRYNELRTIDPGFFEERKDIYNLYPLLVHTRLFGGGYADSVNAILSRFV